MEPTRDQLGKYTTDARSTSPLLVRNLSLGLSILTALDRRVLARGTSRSVEAVRYATRALNAPRQPASQRPLRRSRAMTGGYKVGFCWGGASLDGRNKNEKNAAIWAPASFWERVRVRGVEYDETVSASMRVLIRNGFVIERPIDRPLRKCNPVQRAIELLPCDASIDLAQLDELIWPDRGRIWPANPRPQGGRGLYAARLLSKILEERRILVPAPADGLTARNLWIVNKPQRDP